MIKDFKIDNKTSIGELADQFLEAGGFTAKKLATGTQIFKDMLGDKKCIKFLSFPSCLMATGTRGVIRDMVKNKMIDVIITTGGTLALDILRMYKEFYPGEFQIDDAELHKKGYHRLGNVLIKKDEYGPFMEDWMQPHLEELYKSKKEWSSAELASAFGEILSKERNCEESVLYWAWKNSIPIFVPGLIDGVFGSNLWMFSQKHRDFKIDLLRDEDMISDIIFNAKKSGAIVIGGGISKHHNIWWNSLRGGLNYAVYITTAQEYDGSLSGAQTREAISWNKINAKAKHITIEGDATILLPLLAGSLCSE